MSSINVSDVPLQMRPVSRFVQIANEYGTRDVVIQYWCLLKALEDGMNLGGNDQAAKKFLLDLMTVLEKMKHSHKDNDGIMQEIVAQSHIENQAQLLFQFAYGLDLQGNFGQKAIRAYYTAGYLFDVLTCFGQLDENIQSARKYAKWRAIDINNCLKNGEQPKPARDGNQTVQQEKGDQDDIATQINEKLSAELNELNASMTKLPQSPASYNQHQIPPANYDGQQPQRPPVIGLQEPFRGTLMTGVSSPATLGHAPSIQQQGALAVGALHHSPKSPPGRQIGSNSTTIQQSMADLTLEEYIEAKKLTKYAQSAMDYEDPKTAIDYLQKAISILQKNVQQ